MEDAPTLTTVTQSSDLSLPKPFRALALSLAFGQADIDEPARTQLVETPARFETLEPNPNSRSACAIPVGENCPAHPLHPWQSAGRRRKMLR